MIRSGRGDLAAAEGHITFNLLIVMRDLLCRGSVRILPLEKIHAEQSAHNHKDGCTVNLYLKDKRNEIENEI